jgi:cytochrome c oxidase subunit 4
MAHDAAHAATHGHHGEGHPLVGHVVPWQVLLTVCVALLVLTIVTVWVAGINLGPLNLWVALLVATTKATLVILYFMHMRYDRPFNAIVLIASFVFVLLFVGLALTDTHEYRGEITWKQVDLQAARR